MDFLTIFLNLFSMVFFLYKNIVSLFYGKGPQLLKYDKESSKVFAVGFIDFTCMRVTVEHFSVDGDYTIFIDHEIIPSIKKRNVDGFDGSKTYFLTRNKIYYDTYVSIKIHDNISENVKQWKFNPGDGIDFIKLMNQMDE